MIVQPVRRRRRPTLRLLAGALLATALLPACAPAEPDADGGAQVRFTSPAEGAELASPVEVCMEASGITIEAAGDAVVPASGHHHVIVDPSPEELAAYTTGPGAPIAKDATHIHMGDGSGCTSLELTPGEHQLLAVVADALHQPLDPPVASTVTIVVK